MNKFGNVIKRNLTLRICKIMNQDASALLVPSKNKHKRGNKESILSTTEEKTYAASQPGLSAYVEDTFQIRDGAFSEIEQRAAAGGLPAIHVSPFDARLLEVIARAIGALKIVEIGALAGLSGVSLARALPAEGVLHTFELEPHHAEIVRETFVRNNLLDKVRIHLGPALQMLRTIESEGPFDLVFIDADKPGYFDYLKWTEANLRIGGVVLGDNVFAGGLIAQPKDSIPPGKREYYDGITRFNARLADPTSPWRSTIIPTGEGLAMAVKIR